MKRTRPWTLALAAFGAAACGTAGRPGLPSPFPLTHGATPLPADGLGAGFELGQGLRRPEQERADLLTLFIAGQHDRLRSFDLVAPTEFTLTSRRSRIQLRAVCGPRATVERYTDFTDPDRSATCCTSASSAAPT